jgi:hypothetical protein
MILNEPQVALTLRERGVLRVRGDIYDRVDILGGSDAAGSGIGHEDASGASADEDEFVENGR